MNLTSYITKEELANGVRDKQGVVYSQDGRRLLTCENKDLTHYVVKDGTMVICEEAFNKHEALEEIIIPESVTVIKFCAFYECISLKKVTLPKSVSTIEWCAFDGCKSLTAFSVEAGNKSFCSVDGVLYTKDMKTLWQYPPSYPSTVFNIPEGIETINRYAFRGCQILTEVTIPESVTEIGEIAFEDCISLVKVNYNATDCYVASDTPIFWGCDNLTDIVIGDKVTEITGSLFCSCFGLTEVILPDHIKTIGWATFCNCKNLKRVHIPNGVTKIEGCAFEECISLIDVVIPNSVTEIGCFAFAYCTNLEHIHIPNSVEKIDYHAFSPMSPTKLDIAEDNPRFCVKDGVLYSKDMTTLIEFPSSLELTSFRIPETVTSIERQAFDQCYNLTSIILPSRLTSIGLYAFAYCENIVSITLPESITQISCGAFARCSKLKTIISLNSQPPECGFIFELEVVDEEEAEKLFKQCTLCVPRGTKEAYATADEWKHFKNIEEIN